MAGLAMMPLMMKGMSGLGKIGTELSGLLSGGGVGGIGGSLGESLGSSGLKGLSGVLEQAAQSPATGAFTMTQAPPVSPAWKFLQLLNQGMSLSQLMAGETAEGGMPMYGAQPGDRDRTNEWPTPPQLPGLLSQLGGGQPYVPTAAKLQDLDKKRRQNGR